MAQQALDNTEKAILTYVADAWQEIAVYKKGPQGRLGTLSHLPPRDTMGSPTMEVTMGAIARLRANGYLIQVEPGKLTISIKGLLAIERRVAQ